MRPNPFAAPMRFASAHATLAGLGRRDGGCQRARRPAVRIRRPEAVSQRVREALERVYAKLAIKLQPGPAGAAA
jgi:hypothetical protein